MADTLAQAHDWTPAQIAELTIPQIRDLFKDPEKLEKELKWTQMAPEVREIAEAVGYFDDAGDE
jgi:hypothetical protein